MKEEALSLTANFITAMVDANEEQDVIIVDLPGTFLQTKACDGTIIKLEGAIVEAIARINPTWDQSLVHEKYNWASTVYSKAIKALYGTVNASKLLFDDPTALLVELGFTPNPYDSCVVNTIIDGKQCTISWHVDDLKIIHKNGAVVTFTIESLSDKYDTNVSLSISQGKVHAYLGMILNFTIKGEVQIIIYDQIDNIIEESPIIYKSETGSAASP